jgi:hypothetical protein
MPGFWSASLMTPGCVCATWLKDKDIDGRRNRYQIQTHLPREKPSAGNETSVRSWTYSSKTTPPNQPGERTPVNLPDARIAPGAAEL